VLCCSDLGRREVLAAPLLLLLLLLCCCHCICVCHSSRSTLDERFHTQQTVDDAVCGALQGLEQAHTLHNSSTDTQAVRAQHGSTAVLNPHHLLRPWLQDGTD
jgi:hypothetical protein